MKTITKSENPIILFISDIHGNLKIVDKSVKYINKHKPDVLVLGGDTPDQTKANFKQVLKKFLKTKIPIVIYPGSHENGDIYGPVMKECKSKYLIDAYKKSNRILRAGPYELIIIPGSDVVYSGGRAWKGGSYWVIDQGEAKSITRHLTKRLQTSKVAKKVTPTFLDDIEHMIKEKSKAPASKKIIFTHCPPKFKTNKGTDLAQYGVVTKEFKLKHKVGDYKVGRIMQKGGILLFYTAKKLKELSYPIKLHKRNVGNTSFNKLMNKFRITKYIAGHIHEAGPRAITKKEKHIKQNTLTKELILNNGYGLKGYATLLHLEDKGIKYKFLKF